jgi:F-type H+-transporting ATPase subunit delta
MAVSNRYAKAFVDVVFDAKLDVQKILTLLHQLVGTYESSEDLRKIWGSPAVPADQKRALLDQIVKQMGDVPRPMRNFIAVLIDHSRINILPDIAKQFETELNTRLGRVEAEVTSARQLSESERQALVAQVSQTTGRQVSAKYSVDAALLGGAVVRVGSTVYDGSVRGQLQKIKQELVSE